MGSIELGSIALGIVLVAVIGGLLYWMLRPADAARPGLPEITPEAIDTGIDNLAIIARRFAQAAEHAVKVGKLTKEQRRAWVIERLKMYIPIVPSHLWELALDAALGEIDEGREVMRVQPPPWAQEPSPVTEFEVNEDGTFKLVGGRPTDDMVMRSRVADDPLGLDWKGTNDTSYPDHRGERPPGSQ